MFMTSILCFANAAFGPKVSWSVTYINKQKHCFKDARHEHCQPADTSNKTYTQNIKIKSEIETLRIRT